MCLRKKHLVRECNSKGKCFRCSQKHHISLCNLYEKKTFPTVVKKSEEPAVEKGQEPVAGAQVTKTATGLYVNFHKFVLLQTAACIVSSTISANTGIELHIIFDQGSQHSYLSQRDALNLNTVTKERLSINAFGAKEEEFKICDEVEIVVGSLFDKFEMKIDTFVVDNICNPLEENDLYEIQSKYPHLSNIQLADDSNGERKMEIDLLIGLDHL